MDVIQKRIEQTLKLVEEFAAMNQQWATQEGAYMECCAATKDFLHWLGAEACIALGAKSHEFYCTEQDRISNRSEEINPKPDFFIGPSQMNDKMGLRQAPWHCIVQTADFYIDFTGRQYFSTCAYPLIIPKANYLAMAASAGVTE
jgi:hypothetical protein